MIETRDASLKANKRIELIFWLLIIAGAGVALQLVNLQLLQYSFYRGKAQKMHLSTVKQQIGRGTIFDRNGKKLAESVKSNSIYVCPREVVEKARAADVLSKKLGLSRDAVLKKIYSRSGFEYIKRKVEADAAGDILGQKLKGVYAETEEKRYYPLGDTAAHITGFSGMDNTGLEGLESGFEKYLRGKTGRVQIRRDAWQRPIMIDSVDIKKAERGADLILTIDADLQYAAKDELEKAVKKFNGTAGSMIVMNPNTGAIYALVNYPSYDPNTRETYSNDTRRNRAISDMYEPGSTFKTFTMSAYIKEFPDCDSQKVFCGNGQQEFFGRIVHDHEKYGWLTPAEVLKYSSNIGMVNLALKVPQEKLFNEYDMFGFGKMTGIDMPEETQGMLRNYKSWDNTTLTSIPYGQEVAVTPIQLMRGYAAVANGGYLVTPHVVDRIEKDGSVVYRGPSDKGKKIMDDRYREKLVAMLRLVTEKDGSGKRAAISGYNVAGKTGTAQKHNKNGKGYAVGKYVASFIGFLPAENPEILTLVVVDEPRPNYYGGDVAAPAFKNINTAAITALHVAADASTAAEAARPAAQAEIEMPDLYLKDFNAAKKILSTSGVKFERYGFGRLVIGQKPAAGKIAAKGEPVYLLLGDRAKDSSIRVYMPDVRGLSIRKAMEICNAFGIKVKCTGSGNAVTQEPKPGVALPKGKACVISFAVKDET
jgi:cell division protein FtsI/penicillin-binding protein 2